MIAATVPQAPVDPGFIDVTERIFDQEPSEVDPAVLACWLDEIEQKRREMGWLKCKRVGKGRRRPEVTRVLK